MPTTVTKIVDPDSGAGFDYTSLNLWEAGQQGDLPTLDEIHVAKCRSTSGTADTTAVVIDGWTTDATRYIKIWTDPAESYRAYGKWDVTKYRLSPTGAAIVFRYYEDFIRMEGIQLSTDTAGVIIRDSPSVTAGSDFRFGYGILNNVNIYDFVSGFNVSDSSNTSSIYIYNTIFLATYQNASYGFIINAYTSNPIYLYNCDFINQVVGIARSTGVVTLINCLFSGNTTDAVGTIFDTYCATTNDNTKGLTALGTGNRFSQTFTFTAAGDYHLASNDGGALDYGDGLTVKSIFTDDIDLVARPATDLDWDIGADEYVEAGGVYIPRHGFINFQDPGVC